MDKDTSKKGLRRLLFNKGRISSLFRNWNIALFTLAFFLMVIMMLAAFYSVIKQISTEYAGSYAASLSEALSAHIDKEIALLAKAARSGAVIDWLSDEDNNEKKVIAYEEMTGIIGELYSNNLYVGLEKSMNEYKIYKDYAADNIRPLAALDKNNPDYAWYFKCIESDRNHILSVGIDRVSRKKQIWLNYKVVHNGVSLGVISTGLDFSNLARELFLSYKNVIRGKIGRAHV